MPINILPDVKIKTVKIYLLKKFDQKIVDKTFDKLNTQFYMQTRTKKPKIIFFPTSMADIDKNLNVKPKIKYKIIILEQYWDYSNVFDKNKTNQLPAIRGKKVNHEIELLGKKPTVFWGPLFKKRIFGIEENIARIFG